MAESRRGHRARPAGGDRRVPVSVASARREEWGQASVEVVAALPAMIATGLVLLQLFAVGYTTTLADGAAEAGALAIAAGRSPEPAVRNALPNWARSRVLVKRSDDSVEVSVKPPSPLASLSDRLRVSSSAAVARRRG